jgi:hypothetical protein
MLVHAACQPRRMHVLHGFSGACDQKISTSAEKLLCMVKAYEYRYRAQDKPSQMQRRNRSISEGPRRMEWRLTHSLASDSTNYLTVPYDNYI